jgi:hypothetical protein
MRLAGFEKTKAYNKIPNSVYQNPLKIFFSKKLIIIFGVIQTLLSAAQPNPLNPTSREFHPTVILKNILAGTEHKTLSKLVRYGPINTSVFITIFRARSCATSTSWTRTMQTVFFITRCAIKKSLLQMATVSGTRWTVWLLTLNTRTTNLWMPPNQYRRFLEKCV